MGDRLETYRRKRDRTRTPEPFPESAPDGPAGGQRARFVIQQHHARRLHWDLRLERDGVLVSWAVPRGLPRDPGRNQLAVHTEDHPLEYLDFAGEIPAGEYGGGRMTIFDQGHYTTEKWRDDEVLVRLRGERTDGRYVLFRTGGRDWMVRRLDPAPPGWTPMPQRLRPMRATRAAKLPGDDEAWGYEMRWDGLRAIGYVSGGRLRLVGEAPEEQAAEVDLTSAYPHLRELAEELAPVEAVLDGELVTFDPAGRVRPAPPPVAPGRRVTDTAAAQYLIFDLLWLDGTPSTPLGYAQRRELLEGLALAGGHWQTPPYFPGGGRHVLRAAREQGLPGVVAKRLDAGYLPGRRSRDWLTVDVR